MRLYNVYYLCKVSIEGIKKIQYTGNNYANRNHDYTIEGWTGCSDTCRFMENFGIFF